MIQTTRRDAKSASGHFAPLFLLCYVAIAGQTHGAAQGQPAPVPAPQAPATDTVAPDIPGVVKGGTKVEVVKQGFRATDGPVPLPDGSLIFWNFPDKAIVKIDKDGNASTFLTQGVGVGRNGAQAMTFDSKGRLITLDKDKTSTRIAVVYPPGSEKVLVDACEGKPMPEANDLIADKKGGVYFSDQDGFVFYGRPDGTCVKVQTEADRLNGIVLSRDEKTLYVTTQGRTPRAALTSADLKTDGGDTLLAYDIQPDGTLRNRRVFARYEFINRRPEGLPDQRFGGDGIAIDSQERLYATTAAGIQVFSPQGKLLGTIPTSRNPQNLAFAGQDKKTLYITARGAIYKIQMLSEGFKGRPK
jgi:gluconolactonase